ncbi:MAG: 3-isopropylmalate dehydrogenase [Candidatus Lindowbacteria bacterium RIFCSPLOWO2_12_FULL_62_27]|nr:MAG: 3-isopropylmalate dehydrogenase [Candidatus Lindowbacteria bacterium RIFCSPLOWO2_02_FULL_62_12]OGH62782.1 MAG: 3-isopropylmalate dehydrogenase [Candidatus Lindowbacteria bacterium RIFCSPLOWO2_12_FULL_62_27]
MQQSTKKRYRLAILPGDGIGPEVMEAALRVMERVGEAEGIAFEFEEYRIGGAAIDAYGEPLRDADLDRMRACDAALMAAIGGTRWDRGPAHLRPEAGLLKIRKGLGVFANLRPAKIFRELVGASRLKPEVASRVDLIVFRELTGGLYFGEPRGRTGAPPAREALNTMRYGESEVRRIAEMAFRAARLRRRRVTSVDKANVLEVSQLWREIVVETHRSFSDVELTHLYVDNAAMQLVRDPGQFDVILTENLFGDILSDLCAELVGSIGLMPSASLGAANPGLFEPVHGSAPDIAGKGLANPLAMILTAAMMFRHGLSLPRSAGWIESAVESALEGGARTTDLGGRMSTQEMTACVLKHLEGSVAKSHV